MSTIRPFKAIRPREDLASSVAALPYDVYNTAEARAEVEREPLSFLRIDRAETQFPKGTDPYSDIVYKKAREILDSMISDGSFIQDDKPCFYIYALTMNGRTQNGIVGCASIDDYISQVILKHENTLEAKEQDRIRHVDTCSAQTGPIFLTYRPVAELKSVVSSIKRTPCLYDFTSSDGVRHQVWMTDDDSCIENISQLFAHVPHLYIADGHHRSASAVRIGRKRRAQNPDYTGDEEFNYFLCVLFPDEQLYCMDYNRVVADLNGLSKDEFLAKVSEKFDVQKLDKPLGNDEQGKTDVQQKHTFGMYLEGQWYLLTAKPGTFDANDVVEQLDVAILQKNLLSPVLGIGDPRVDKRIDFVGGIRGLKELEKRVDSGAAVAFAMCPTSMSDLFAIADAGKIMPPKSTWFEPKLLSGIFVHELR